MNFLVFGIFAFQGANARKEPKTFPSGNCLQNGSCQVKPQWKKCIVYWARLLKMVLLWHWGWPGQGKEKTNEKLSKKTRQRGNYQRTPWRRKSADSFGVKWVWCWRVLLFLAFTHECSKAKRKFWGPTIEKPSTKQKLSIFNMIGNWTRSRNTIFNWNFSLWWALRVERWNTPVNWLVFEVMFSSF